MNRKKYFNVTALFFLLIGLFFFYHGFYFPVNIKGPSIKAKFYTPNNKPINDSIKLKLHVFNTGINKVSSLLVGDVNPWRPVPAFVIEHPKYGLIVFDTGLSSTIARIGNKALHPITRQLFDTKTNTGDDLPNQMTNAGLQPNEVKIVIFSHLHFDHIGNAEAFADATFCIGQNSGIDKMTRMNGFEPAFINKLKQNHPFKNIDFSEAKPFATFKKTIDLFGDGSLIIVQGNGHLNGSIAMFVNLPQGMVFLAGDEAVHFDWLKNNDVQRISKNPKRAAAVRNRIRMLIKLKPNMIVFPGHDFPKIPKNRTDIIVHNPKLFNINSFKKNR